MSPLQCGVLRSLDCPKREFELRSTPAAPLDDVAPSSGQSQDASSQFFFSSRLPGIVEFVIPTAGYRGRGATIRLL